MIFVICAHFLNDITCFILEKLIIFAAERGLIVYFTLLGLGNPICSTYSNQILI